MKPDCDMAKKKKSFFDMTPAERDRDVARFDKPLPDSAFKPLSPKQRSLFDRMRGPKSAPPSAQSSAAAVKATVRVDLDAGLIKQLDTIAKRKHLTRSELIEQGLRGMLASFV